MSCECEKAAQELGEQKVLLTLLLINACMFVLEFVFGLLSESTALIADSLDMLADATVYTIALYAVGKSASAKIGAAQTSGVLQMVLGLGVLLDVMRRLVWGSEPESLLMIGIGLLALIANLIYLKLIARHKDGEIHMRASWIFSRNDVIANLGIILGGLAVAITGSHYPDLLIGLIIAIIVLQGGLQICRQTRIERQVCTDL
jgi:cation diffusion facilitator family transporter